MAVRDKSEVIGQNGLIVLHVAVGHKSSVEIREPRDVLSLTRKVNGVSIQVVEDPNFTTLKTGQTIPWGAIRAQGPEGTRVRYRIRTRGDVTGDPELD
ncbi:hypothetical protein ACFWB2_13945 [Streptomyces virginiae]|uniref:hypothetical protein n=1 Tax=Streptomyces TaxID=1883 RepID=UPI00137119F3|nr:MULTISPECIES: hypothetical protein [Streptomyces]MCX4718718.1 hypothetical protein [Streptomyces virginiae]MCX5276357.1 hypothetical protein [Streptomyces virginiae]MYV80035.1 hypothetical protein [Streptomyces sp. SID1046]WSC75531.1 hypothetical protein OHA56_03940 [Streptomyces virginiae]